MKAIKVKRQIDRPLAQTPTTRTLLLALGLIVILVLAVSSMLAQGRKTRLAPPADFQQAAEIDLSARPYDAETLMQFSLEETAVVGIFFTIRDIDTTYFDLSLSGLDGDSLVILHSEDYRTDRDGGGLWEQSLPPGAYRLVLTAAQSPGALSVYWGYR